jgi:hypothetical protein
MPNEANALSGTPGAPGQEHYQTMRAGLSSSARGRSAADDNARRNRHAVTQMLLAAIGRLEAEIATGSNAVERFGDELRQLLQAIRLARPEWVLDGDLAALLQLLERRIDALVEPAAPAPVRARLAVVPPPEEPELPIPAPLSAQTLAISLVESAPRDPLAALKALSEEELIALFT